MDDLAMTSRGYMNALGTKKCFEKLPVSTAENDNNLKMS